MQVRIFTIPFDADKELFSDDDLSRFLLNKRVLGLHPQFFQTQSRPYWTVFIEYEAVVGEEQPKSDNLDDAQRLLLQRLKEWRKQAAEEGGVPVFIVATNKQLLDVVRRAPRSLEALREVQGFGKKKIERHGKQVLDIVSAFFEKRPVRKETPKSEPGSGAVREAVETGKNP